MAIKINSTTVISNTPNVENIVNITHTGSLTTGGNATINGTNFLKVPVGTAAQQPGQGGQPAAATGQIRFNSTLTRFEGFDGTSWGEIGGSAALHVMYVDYNGNLDYTLYNKDSGTVNLTLAGSVDRAYVSNFVATNKQLISVSSGQLSVEILG
jgi:hypothetical protein